MGAATVGAEGQVWWMMAPLLFRLLARPAIRSPPPQLLLGPSACWTIFCCGAVCNRMLLVPHPMQHLAADWCPDCVRSTDAVKVILRGQGHEVGAALLLLCHQRMSLGFAAVLPWRPGGWRRCTARLPHALHTSLLWPSAAPDLLPESLGSQSAVAAAGVQLLLVDVAAQPPGRPNSTRDCWCGSV